MKGWRTIAIGVLQVLVGIADLVAQKADLLKTGGLEGYALLLSGALMIVLRVMTNTPMGKASNE